MINLSREFYFRGEKTEEAEMHLKDFLKVGSFKTVVKGFLELWEKQPRPDLLVLERFRRGFAIVASHKIDEDATDTLNAAVKSVSDAANFLFACKGNYGELVELMCENEVDLEVHVEETGLTPLHFAAENGNPKLAKFLVQNKVPSDQKAKGTLWTPLHYAAYYGREKIVDVLVNAEADPNARTSEGDTPLHLAADQNWITLCFKLVFAGADTTLVDSQGNRAVDLLINTFSNFEKPSETIFSQVPKDVVGLIWRKLPVSDQLSAREVCKEWNQFSSEHIFAEFKRLSLKENSGSRAG